MRFAILFPLLLGLQALGQEGYVYDSTHKFGGSHVEGQENCGSNYMLPMAIAPLGSHTFMILGQDGPNHVLADYRSGTPPHNYQVVLRIKLDSNELDVYKKLVAESKRPPGLTTINFQAKPVDRYLFCLRDLPKIFGPEKKRGDVFESLFPMRVSLLKDPDYEADFDPQKIFHTGSRISIDRGDVELIVYRYLPAYLDQKTLRQAIEENPKQIVPRLAHAPVSASEPVESASLRKSYSAVEGALMEPKGKCAKDPLLKYATVPKTIHTFLLLGEVGANEVIAVNYMDTSPNNFQTVLKLKFTDDEMRTYRAAKKNTTEPPVLQTRNANENFYFCFSDLRALVDSGRFHARATIHRGSDLVNYKLGEPVGQILLIPKNVEVLVNRKLRSFLNPLVVARDVLDKELPEISHETDFMPDTFVDVTQVHTGIQVEMRYFSDWNFFGRVVPGYFANKCLLTKPAAEALAKAQSEVEKLGYSILVFDCYRPQTAVTAFVKWSKDPRDQKMKKFFYPAEEKRRLFRRGYISKQSGHSRGSTVDLTLVKSAKPGKWYREIETEDCRYPKNIEATGQVDMGTTYDCFSDLAAGASTKVSKEARANRELLKSVMERAGFRPYEKEWWHFTLRDEPYKAKYFDFPVR